MARAKKKYSSMREAANAVSKKVNVCQKGFFSLSNDEKLKVSEVMKQTKNFRPNKYSGKSKLRDFYDRLDKYVCKR